MWPDLCLRNKVARMRQGSLKDKVAPWRSRPLQVWCQIERLCTAMVLPSASAAMTILWSSTGRKSILQSIILLHKLNSQSTGMYLPTHWSEFFCWSFTIAIPAVPSGEFVISFESQGSQNPWAAGGVTGCTLPQWMFLGAKQHSLECWKALAELAMYPCM